MKTLVGAAEPERRRPNERTWTANAATTNTLVTASAPLWGGADTLASSATTLVTFGPAVHHRTSGPLP